MAFSVQDMVESHNNHLNAFNEHTLDAERGRQVHVNYQIVLPITTHADTRLILRELALVVLPSKGSGLKDDRHKTGIQRFSDEQSRPT